MKFKYKLFGVTFASYIKLGSLPITKFVGEPDVKILANKVRRPRKNLKNTLYKPFTVANKTTFFWEVENIVKFLVQDSHTIYIDQHKLGLRSDVITFFLDTVLTVALIKNNVFVFHAAAIKAKGKAYIFCAGPGSGKSTLAAYFFKYGYQYIEDDKCLLIYDPKKDKVFIQNGLPFSELWTPQTGFLHKTKAKLLGRVRKNIQKFRFDITECIPKRRTPVEKIFLITMDNYTDDKVIKSEITGLGKINVVKNHSHLDYFIQVLGKSKEHFKYLATVCQKLEVVKLSRSRITHFQESIKIIEDEISN